MKEKKVWKNILTKEFLTEHHLVQCKNLNQIAREVGCHVKSVYDYCSFHYIAVVKYKPKGATHGCWRGFGEISGAYWSNVRNGSRNRNLTLNITIEDAWEIFLSQNRKCALSGREIGFGDEVSNTASLDRIDASIGYEPGNIQWVHKDLNYAKQSLNNSDFILLCKEVPEYNEKK